MKIDNGFKVNLRSIIAIWNVENVRICLDDQMNYVSSENNGKIHHKWLLYGLWIACRCQTNDSTQWAATSKKSNHFPIKSRWNGINREILERTIKSKLEISRIIADRSNFTLSRSNRAPQTTYITFRLWIYEISHYLSRYRVTALFTPTSKLKLTKIWINYTFIFYNFVIFLLWKENSSQKHLWKRYYFSRTEMSTRTNSRWPRLQISIRQSVDRCATFRKCCPRCGLFV